MLSTINIVTGRRDNATPTRYNRAVDEFQELLETDNPVLRIQMASARMDRQRRAMAPLAGRRGHTLAELRQVQSVTWIADQLGVTRQQVYRLLREALGRDYRPEDHEDSRN